MVNILGLIFKSKRRNLSKSTNLAKSSEISRSITDLEKNLEPSVLHPLRAAPSMIITQNVNSSRLDLTNESDARKGILDPISMRYFSTLKAAKKFKTKSAQSIFASILTHYDSDGDNLLDLQEATSAAKDYGITGNSLTMFLNMADWKNSKIEIKELSRMLPEMLRQTKSPEMICKIYRHLCNPNGKMDFDKCFEALRKFNPRINQGRLQPLFESITSDKNNQIEVDGFVRLFRMLV